MYIRLATMKHRQMFSYLQSFTATTIIAWSSRCVFRHKINDDDGVYSQCIYSQSYENGTLILFWSAFPDLLSFIFFAWLYHKKWVSPSPLLSSYWKVFVQVEMNVEIDNQCVLSVPVDSKKKNPHDTTGDQTFPRMGTVFTIS